MANASSIPNQWKPPIPWKVVAPLILAALLGKKRPFHKDAQACIGLLQPPLQVFGTENIPPTGPYLLTINHYTRPGLDAWWMALAASSALPVEIHWITAEAWAYTDPLRSLLFTPVTRWAFRRVEAVYGFTPMPPIPPRPHETLARARAVRQALEYARRTPQAVIGLAPEGGDSPGAVLGTPPSGVGRFISHLAEQGLHILPVGVYEAGGCFCLRFGLLYDLELVSDLARDKRDRLVSWIVMSHIARLLPQRLQGAFCAKNPN